MFTSAAAIRALGAGLLIGAAGCSSTPAPAAAADALIGAWESRVQFSSGAFSAVKDLKFLYVFNAGGTLTESSNYDAAPPVPPAYGAWQRTGERTFQARYVFYTTRAPGRPEELIAGPSGWVPAGSGVLLETITVAADGTTFDSTINLQLRDGSGQPIDGGGSATAHAVRITTR